MPYRPARAAQAEDDVQGVRQIHQLFVGQFDRGAQHLGLEGREILDVETRSVGPCIAPSCEAANAGRIGP